jgi:hypothetical protein
VAVAAAQIHLVLVVLVVLAVHLVLVVVVEEVVVIIAAIVEQVGQVQQDMLVFTLGDCYGQNTTNR